MRTNNNIHRVVTVPRGINVGYTVIDDLKQNNLLHKEVISIDSQRDPVNRAIVVNLELKR